MAPEWFSPSVCTNGKGCPTGLLLRGRGRGIQLNSRLERLHLLACWLAGKLPASNSVRLASTPFHALFWLGKRSQGQIYIYVEMVVCWSQTLDCKVTRTIDGSTANRLWANTQEFICLLAWAMISHVSHKCLVPGSNVLTQFIFTYLHVY